MDLQNRRHGSAPPAAHTESSRVHGPRPAKFAAHNGSDGERVSVERPLAPRTLRRPT